MTAADPPLSEVRGWLKSTRQKTGKQQCVKITQPSRRLPPNLSISHFSFQLSAFSLSVFAFPASRRLPAIYALP
jgi:hypothetical protein